MEVQVTIVVDSSPCVAILNFTASAHGVRVMFTPAFKISKMFLNSVARTFPLFFGESYLVS